MFHLLKSTTLHVQALEINLDPKWYALAAERTPPGLHLSSGHVIAHSTAACALCPYMCMGGSDVA